MATMHALVSTLSLFAAFDIVTDSRDELAEMLRAWTAAAERLMAGLPAGLIGPVGGRPELPPDDTGEALDLDTANLTITIGFGPGMFRDDNGNDRFGLAERQPKVLRPLPRFPLDTLIEGTSGGDICIQACADDPQIAVHAIRNLTRIGFGSVGMRWSQHGFGRSSSTTRHQTTPRNLMGFKDGTANIRAEDTEELDTHVWVAADDDPADWLSDGSYLITRRAAITVETWDRQTLRDQEAFIGRTKGEGAPLTGDREFDDPDFTEKTVDGPTIPEDAHIRIVHPDNHGGVQMLRRGYNIADGTNEIGRMDGVDVAILGRPPRRPRPGVDLRGHVRAGRGRRRGDVTAPTDTSGGRARRRSSAPIPQPSGCVQPSRRPRRTSRRGRGSGTGRPPRPAQPRCRRG